MSMKFTYNPGDRVEITVKGETVVGTIRSATHSPRTDTWAVSMIREDGRLFIWAEKLSGGTIRKL